MDHLKVVDEHIDSEFKGKEELLNFDDDDDLLNDFNIDDMIDQEFTNLNVEGIRLDGNELNIDLNMMIDVPDYLDGNMSMLNLTKQDIGNKEKESRMDK